MYVLTAAQSYQSAFEVSLLGHGLLTYSLVSEGLEQRKADDNPRDGRIFDREWLGFATTQVPELQAQLLSSSKAAGRGSLGEGGGAISATRDGIQRPKLFYRRELSSPPWIIVESPASSTSAAVSQAIDTVGFKLRVLEAMRHQRRYRRATHLGSRDQP